MNSVLLIVFYVLGVRKHPVRLGVGLGARASFDYLPFFLLTVSETVVRGGVLRLIL